MLIKALLLVALIVAIVTLIKRGQQKNHNNPVQPPTAETTTETASDTETMKRCAECGVHLPEKEALSYQTLYFCCNEHKKAYLQDKDT